jgi:hypothetical protein
VHKPSSGVGDRNLGSSLALPPTARRQISRPFTARMLSMETTKQRAIQALSTLPDDATIEDAIEQLCFLAKVEQGLSDSDAGHLISHEDIREQFLA